MDAPETGLPSQREYAEERERVLDERFVALYGQQRSYPFLFGSLGFCLAMWGITWIPGARSLLHVTPNEMAVAMALQGLAFVVAVVCARHWGGVLGRPHLLAERLETMVTALVAGGLIYLSDSAASFFWFFAAAHALHCASDLRGALFSRISHAVVLCSVALAFANDGKPSEAAMMLFCGAVILFLARAQEQSYQRILDLEVERNLLQKRLENVAVLQERTRIARDLHDGVGAQLAAVAWGADALVLEGSDDAERLRELSQRARTGLADLRHIVSDLKAEEMDLARFAAEVEQRGRQLVPSGCSFSVKHRGDVRIASEPASQIALMIRESVRNAVQHAKPSSIRVDLSQEQEAILVCIDDDGLGLPPHATESSHGGLAHLKHRAAALGADLKLEGSTRGTSVRIRLNRSAVSR